jgi:hypothetical protein
VAEQNNMTADDVRKLVLLAERYTSEQMQAFVALRTAKTQQPLSSSFFEVGAAVQDEKKRFTLFKKACEQNWEFARFAEEVAKINGHKTAGRGFAVPQSMHAFVRSLEQKTSGMYKFANQVVLTRLDGVLENTSPSQVTPELLAEVEAVEASVEKVRDLFDQVVTRIAESRAKLQNIQAGKTSDDGAQSAPSDESDTPTPKARIAPGKKPTEPVPPARPKRK